MNIPRKKDIIAHLEQFITENKRSLFDKVLENRTRYITIVLEDIYQPHNASATIRTCDCFGIQELHVIENRNRYTINHDVTLGSSKWVDLVRFNRLSHNNTPDCLNALKDKGYRLVATTSNQEGYEPSELPLDKPVAVMFGTEVTGLTDIALEQAEDFLRIPMYGFTESFNISVSVALVLYELSSRLRKMDLEWRLNDAERTDIELRWIRKVLKRSDVLEKQFFENRE